jgi:uncharacterized protein YqjF (DUF2071 family)
MHQRWQNLLFLHWRVEPAAIAGMLPPRLHVDMFDGSAWLGVVPFFMCDVRPARCPAVPLISNFLELNVRTYVYDHDGKPGVWFFSLDCNQPIAVFIARTFFHLNYRCAVMHASRKDGIINYYSRLRGMDWGVDFAYSARGEAAPAVPGSLEFFLVERYFLHAKNRSGTILRGRVNHAPYQITAADCDASWDTIQRLTAPIGLPGVPDHICMAADVNVSIHALVRVT